MRPIDTIRNLAGKRVCDISEDLKTVEIVVKNYVTRITVNKDGKLQVVNERRPLNE